MNIKNKLLTTNHMALLFGLFLLAKTIYEFIFYIKFPITTLFSISANLCLILFSIQWIKHRYSFTPLFSFFLPYYFYDFSNLMHTDFIFFNVYKTLPTLITPFFICYFLSKYYQWSKAIPLALFSFAIVYITYLKFGLVAFFCLGLLGYLIMSIFYPTVKSKKLWLWVALVLLSSGFLERTFIIKWKEIRYISENESKNNSYPSEQ